MEGAVLMDQRGFDIPGRLHLKEILALVETLGEVSDWDSDMMFRYTPWKERKIPFVGTIGKGVDEDSLLIRAPNVYIVKIDRFYDKTGIIKQVKGDTGWSLPSGSLCHSLSCLCEKIAEDNGLYFSDRHFMTESTLDIRTEAELHEHAGRIRRSEDQLHHYMDLLAVKVMGVYR
jgi:hypothetical protein